MKFLLDIDSQIPLRDGTLLSATIWRPVDGTPAPVIVIRTPYGKGDSKLTYSTDPNLYAFLDAGYAVVLQETRGVFRSGGEFAPYSGDAADGADTVRWLLAQPWCDGNIGSWGQSYMGMVQWALASTGVEGLRAIVPAQSSADFYRAHWYSPGGAMSLDTSLSWCALIVFNKLQRDLAHGDSTVIPDLMEVGGILTNVSALSETLPIAHHPVLVKHAPWLADVLAHPGRDDYWREQSPLEDFEQVTVPALNIAGWYDTFVTETLRAYNEMRKRGGTVEAREGQRLIVGPWGHAPEFVTGDFPDRRFGPLSGMLAANLGAAQLRFLNRWVKGDESALDDVAPVRIFVMGINQWRDETEWPLPDTRYVDYYLSATSASNSASGGGTLSTTVPDTDGQDVYLYNPLRPVPTVGGNILALGQGEYAGPSDQAEVELREDVLCFTTPMLEHAVEVTGHVSLTLNVSSSALDTDFTGKLVDVQADGRAIILCEGIQRMRYRESLGEPLPLEPHTVYEVTFDLAATSNVFLPGHRIRLEVSSSNFPRYDRNTNTGGNIATDGEADTKIALNTVHHGPAHLSRLTLPLIER